MHFAEIHWTTAVTSWIPWNAKNTRTPIEPLVELLNDRCDDAGWDFTNIGRKLSTNELTRQSYNGAKELIETETVSALLLRRRSVVVLFLTNKSEQISKLFLN